MKKAYSLTILLSCLSILSVLLFASLTVSLVHAQASSKQLCVDNICSYASVQAAFSAATNGSTITISGEWNQGGALGASNVTIRGLSGAHLKSGPVQGKAGMVISGSNTTIEDLECSNMNVPDENGACIRMEGSGLTLRNVNFHDSQNGVLASTNAGPILIENSTFERNGYNGGAGYAHGIYVNGGNTELTIRDSRFIRSKLGGHEVKSRAAKTTIENSVIATLDGVDSRNIDIPNGGVVVIRNNVIEQGPQSENNEAIGIGLEGVKHSQNSILIENNYIILERSGSNTLLNAKGMPTPTIQGNTIVGGNNPGGSNIYYSSRSAAGIAAYPFLPSVPGGGGSSTPAPTVSITAAPSSITTGGSATITWSSTNSTSCTASNGWTGSKATAGTQTVSPTQTASYTLTCTGAGGSANKSALVTVASGGGSQDIPPGEEVSCHRILSGTSVPTGYALPWNPLTTQKELLITARCGTSATLTLGQSGSNIYVYKQGYAWKNGAWQPFTVSGGTVAGDWRVGQASVTLPYTESELATLQYTVGYMCQHVNNTWKCGCTNASCTTPGWQLQTLQR